MTLRAIIYDLDGTLLDTSGSIALATNRTRADYGLEPLTVKQVIGYVGYGSRYLVKHALVGDGTAEHSVLTGNVTFKEVYDRFFDHYSADPTGGIQTYPQVMEALTFFQDLGLPQAILTNKPHAVTIPTVEAFGLAPLVDAVLGVHPTPPKPDPTGLNSLLERLGVTAGPDVWMVGDGAADIGVARAAGINSLAIVGGFTDGAELRSLNPTAVVSSFGEAFDRLRREA